jgi:ribosome-binding factor A
MASSRNRKIAEEIKKIVSHLMLVEIKDPRISKLSSVNHVEVTNDLRYTTLYISCFDPKHNVEMTIEGLNSAKGFIRKEIGKRLKLHFTPEPIFKADHSVEHGMHINEILGTLNIKSDEEPDQESDQESPEEDEEEE